MLSATLDETAGATAPFRKALMVVMVMVGFSASQDLWCLLTAAAVFAVVRLIYGVAPFAARSSAPRGRLRGNVRRMHQLQWFLAGLIWAFPALLYLFAFVSYVETGSWPFYGHPDPKQLNAENLYKLADSSLVSSLFAVPAWAICWSWFAKVTKPAAVVRNSVFALVGVGVCLVTLLLDPLHTFTWFVD